MEAGTRHRDSSWKRWSGSSCLNEDVDWNRKACYCQTLRFAYWTRWHNNKLYHITHSHLNLHIITTNCNTHIWNYTLSHYHNTWSHYTICLPFWQRWEEMSRRKPSTMCKTRCKTTHNAFLLLSVVRLLKMKCQMIVPLLRQTEMSKSKGTRGLHKESHTHTHTFTYNTTLK